MLQDEQFILKQKIKMSTIQSIIIMLIFLKKIKNIGTKYSISEVFDTHSRTKLDTSHICSDRLNGK